jgi:ABC-type amino acid transport substrate-binding protein
MAKLLLFLSLTFPCVAVLQADQLGGDGDAAGDSVIKVCYTNWYPFSYDRPGATGIIVELARTVIERLGYTAEFHSMAFLRCLNEVQRQHMTLSLYLSPLSLQVLGEKIVAVEPSVHYQLPAFFIRNTDVAMEVSGFEDLSGRKVAAIRGNSFARKYRRQTNIQWVFVNNNEALWKLLISSRVDAFLAEYQSQIQLSNDLRQRIRVLQPFDSEPLYWAVNKRRVKLG